MSKLILVVDDEESIRVSLNGILQDEGYQVIMAENGTDAIELIREEVPDLVLLDIWMPGMDGIQTLERIRNIYPEITVVMMSGHGTIETAVKSTKSGAFDFIEKPFSLDKVLLTVFNAINFKELKKENEALRQAAFRDYELIGSSAHISGIKSQIQRIAPASTPVLIQGEQGVGKQLVARAIHHFSTRRDKPFVSVNCKSIPEKLLVEELFGYEHTGNTDKLRQKRGRLDLVDSGTLFLDDVEDLSSQGQSELLRIITEQLFERSGGSRPIRVDVRIIVATASSLENEVNQGRFLEELYHQLQIVPFYLLPLRERSEDIQQLITHFVNQFHRREGWEPKTFDESAVNCLKGYDWPGNVRELKNVVERILIMAPGPVVKEEDLPELIPGRCSQSLELSANKEPEITPLSVAREQFERKYLLDAMQHYDWNLDETAAMLKLERVILQRKLIQYGLTPDIKE